ncbi:MAG TPA: hypothetical protein VFU22_33805 [Roseiflexaceae bacterium]|nr:hypothetical protein [Roseiflexaceae bacterium]
MRRADLMRYGLWSGVLAVALGNRRAYAMTTTWLPHLAANSVTLLLPDLYRALDALGRRVQRDSATRPGDWPQLLKNTGDAMVRDNPRYVVYVAPLAAGYLLSSPWLNIYKGALAEKQLAGFGLDSLPHAATAFALTRLIGDTAATATDLSRATDGRVAWVEWCGRHWGLCSALALALATLIWERGEYLVYKHELAWRGSAERINMQWSVRDTVTDCVTNAVGWLLAIVLPR